MMYIHVVPLKTGEACKTKDKKVFGGEGEGRGWGEGGDGGREGMGGGRGKEKDKALT